MKSRVWGPPTSLGVVEVDELLPLVVGQQAEDGAAQGRSHLDDELHLVVGGVTGRDEGGVQGAAEGGQGVHGLLVVESKDGVDPTGELRANCRDSRGREDRVGLAIKHSGGEKKRGEEKKCMHLHKCAPHHFGAATDQPECLDPLLMTCQLGILVFYLDS